MLSTVRWNDRRICAAVCTYNRYELLEKALNTLSNQSISTERYSIIVVDNSPDGEVARDYMEKYDGAGNIRYIYTPTPGLSNARNIAAHECGTEFVAYLDDDAIASPDWLEKLMDAFDKFGDSAGVVGGPILPIWQDARPSWLSDELLGALTVVDWGGCLRVASDKEWIAGANMAFRTEALLQAGAFSTGLGRVGAGGVLLSNEESQVIAKLRASGLSLIWSPEAKVRHLVSSDRLQQGWLRKRYAWQAVSDFIAGASGERPSGDVYWNSLTQYLNSLEPRLRTPRGLFSELDGAEAFTRQVHANYNLIMLLLQGYEIADLPGPSNPAPGQTRH